MIKKYVLFQKDAYLEPLYHFEDIEGEKTYVAGVGH